MKFCSTFLVINIKMHCAHHIRILKNRNLDILSKNASIITVTKKMINMSWTYIDDGQLQTP